MNRFDIFRMSANGVDPDRGTGRVGQMRARTNQPADPPFGHGIHDHDADYHHEESQASGRYGQSSGYDPRGGYARDEQRAASSEWERNRGVFIGDRDRLNADLEARQRRYAMESERSHPGVHEMRGYPQPGQQDLRENQMREPAGQHGVWRGRNEDEDFWGRPRHPEDHPGLWSRVKGVFSGKGPKNYARSDERIREDVCEHLLHHPYVDASDIEVIVREGEVTLSGTVEARMVKRAAEECCDDVRGVKDVHNHLRVKPQGSARIGGQTSPQSSGQTTPQTRMTR